MSQRKYQFVPGEFYHVYNRGTDKRVIFEDTQDYERFQLLLWLLNTTERINLRDYLKANDAQLYKSEPTTPLVAIGAYCLMPNHYHLLVSPLVESGVSQFMQKVSTSYTMYFNQKYDRSGALFQGKFRSEYVNDDRYLRYLYSYIHLNPIKLMQSDWKEEGIRDMATARTFLSAYRFSSYLEMVSEVRKESTILNRSVFPNHFSTVQEAEQEVMEWLHLARGKT